MDLLLLEVSMVLEERLKMLEALKATDATNRRLDNVGGAVSGLKTTSQHDTG